MMKQACKIIAMVSVAGLAAAEADAQSDTDVALANDLVGHWEEAWNKGDGAGVADLYTEDGVHMVAQNTFMGHAEIERLANVATKAGAGNLVISVESVRSYANSVWCSGTYRMLVNGEFTRGNWSGFEVRADGRLKIARSASVTRRPGVDAASPL